MDNDKLQKYMSGSLSPHEKAETLTPPLPQEASELLLSCSPADYSASSIAARWRIATPSCWDCR